MRPVRVAVIFIHSFTPRTLAQLTSSRSATLHTTPHFHIYNAYTRTVASTHARLCTQHARARSISVRSPRRWYTQHATRARSQHVRAQSRRACPAHTAHNAEGRGAQRRPRLIFGISSSSDEGSSSSSKGMALSCSRTFSRNSASVATFVLRSVSTRSESSVACVHAGARAQRAQSAGAARVDVGQQLARSGGAEHAPC